MHCIRHALIGLFWSLSRSKTHSQCRIQSTDLMVGTFMCNVDEFALKAVADKFYAALVISRRKKHMLVNSDAEWCSTHRSVVSRAKIQRAQLGELMFTHCRVENLLSERLHWWFDSCFTSSSGVNFCCEGTWYISIDTFMKIGGWFVIIYVLLGKISWNYQMSQKCSKLFYILQVHS